MFQIILLCTFGALAIAGVLIFSLALGGGKSNTTGPVVIWGTLDKNTFAQSIQQLADGNPDFLQVSYEQKDPDTYIAELTNALASGQGPDLVLLSDEYAYSQSTRVTPIPYTSFSREQFGSVFADAGSPFLGIDGVIAIPFVIDPMVIYWNRDLLNSAGFAKEPLYWDELYGMAKTITKRTDTGSITRATIPFGQYKNYTNAKSILAMLMMQAGGTVTARNAEGDLISALGSPAGDASQASTAALRFYTEFADPSKEDYSWNGSLPNAREAFAAGTLAIYAGYASEKAMITRMNPNLSFSVAPMTQIRSSPKSVTAGRVYGLAIPRTSKNQSGAITVAYLLVGKDINTVFSKALGLPSARRDLLGEKAEGDLVLFNKQALIVRTWIDPDPDRTGQVFRGMIEDSVSGAILLPDAVQRADRQMSSIIGGQ
ncbi:extracellular solute-binding protein [Candidatus Kaiserbacteria bacterium]|nr:extracellular solute-binding protein [Candidatus Kaiserbacteria bacterium]